MWFTCKWYYCKISTGQVDTVSSPRSPSNANMRLEKMREIHSLSLSLTQHLFFQLGERECIHEVPSNRLQLFCSFKGHVIRLQICAEPPTLFLRLLSQSFDCLVRTRIQFHPPCPRRSLFTLCFWDWTTYEYQWHTYLFYWNFGNVFWKKSREKHIFLQWMLISLFCCCCCWKTSIL